MASLNQWVGIGNLTADPELEFTQGGIAKCTFSIAINRKWKNREGVAQEDVALIPIEVWGAQAEYYANYFKKGSPVTVRGRQAISKYTDDEGEQRKISEIVEGVVEFLGDGKQGVGEAGGPAGQDDEGVPF